MWCTENREHFVRFIWNKKQTNSCATFWCDGGIVAKTHTVQCMLSTITGTKQRDMCNDGQEVSVSLSTAAQMPIDSLWSSHFLCGDVTLTQASDDSASNVKLSLI